MRSTPVSAIPRIVSSVTLPDASSTARPALIARGFTQHVQREIVEENHRRPGIQSKTQFGQRLDFDLDEFAAPCGLSGDHLCRSHGFGNAASSMDMVLLDQNRIPQRQPVIAAAAAAHGILLGDAQSRERFARIDDLSTGAGYGVGINAGLAGDRRQQLQEIQRTAFGREQGAGLGADFAEYLIRCDSFAVAGIPDDRRIGVECLDATIEPVATTKHTCFARDDRGAGNALCRDQAGGQVAGTDIFAERGIDVAGNLGSERVIEVDGHKLFGQ